MAAAIDGHAATAQLVALHRSAAERDHRNPPRIPTASDRLEAIRRGLIAASDRLSALHRCRHKLGAEALAHQLAGLHREAQHLAHQLGEPSESTEAAHEPAAGK